MKKLIFLLLLATITLAGFAQQAKHVIVISVDGFRPDFYLDSNWHTNTMQQLMKQGSYAKGMNSVFPSMTYPSHTTMITGVQPARHGVYFNAMFEPVNPAGKVYWHDSAIHAPTLWEAVKEKGLPVSSLFWPVSAGAPVVYNIPDVGKMGEKVQEAFTTPNGFTDTLKAQVFDNVSKIDYGVNTNVARIAAYVIEKQKPALLTIHFFSVDHAEHVEGRNGNMVHEAVANTDSGIAIIIAALKSAGIYESTALIVTGDHGFKDVATNVYPNVWLHENGLCNSIQTNDWKAQFFSVDGSSFLYVKNNDATVIKQVLDILNHLPGDKKKYFAVVDRKKLDALGANPQVPFALTGLNGASLGNDITGEDIKPGKGGAHGYLPEGKDIQTGFIAAGAGISRGKVISEMNERDICSVIAALLQISFPSSEGKVPQGLLK